MQFNLLDGFAFDEGRRWKSGVCVCESETESEGVRGSR